MRRKVGQRGFTLIEMMVAVAIVAFFAAVAWPHYFASVMRAQRVEGVINLESITAAQTSYYAANDRFTTDFSKVDFRSRAAAGATVINTKRYSYTLSQPWGDRSWMCVASADLDGDPWPDVIVSWDRL